MQEENLVVTNQTNNQGIELFTEGQQVRKVQSQLNKFYRVESKAAAGQWMDDQHQLKMSPKPKWDSLLSIIFS